jgi:hypothetical protein
MQLKTIIEKAVKDAVSHYKDNSESGLPRYFGLPIKKIDDTPVNVTFKFDTHMNKEIWMILIITTSKIRVTMDGDTDDMELFRSIIVRDCEKMNIDVETEKVKTIFETLKFNKFVGEFVCDNSRHFATESIDEFDEMENIETTYDSCCVCHDATLTETPCGHHLCVQCWVSLKKMKCPICRAYIKYLDLDDEDSDDDE